MLGFDVVYTRTCVTGGRERIPACWRITFCAGWTKAAVAHREGWKIAMACVKVTGINRHHHPHVCSLCPPLPPLHCRIRQMDPCPDPRTANCDESAPVGSNTTNSTSAQRQQSTACQHKVTLSGETLYIEQDLAEALRWTPDGVWL
jgi:hypothetical protein